MGLIRSEKGVDFPPISHPQPVKSGCLRVSSSEKSCNGSESASGILADFDILVAPEDILSQSKDLGQIDHMPARYSEKDEWGLGFAAGDSSSCEKIVAHIELNPLYHHRPKKRQRTNVDEGKPTAVLIYARPAQSHVRPPKAAGTITDAIIALSAVLHEDKPIRGVINPRKEAAYAYAYDVLGLG
ncbi:hypothetical protein EJ05DRAFT_505571 [Pseudovirgaria hyperparasitica]|uniref:Uncharacterized protein n=1 Tax=Pseudovirgaria hyperparasitica TaxID=470096 RepID=A0A6A6VT51_9PEZI|nr:uncharacterized protein EJ05DRAFT_505571 [Pseudovirgaria hyperparasitica]KAF2752934.1 hypothetical protein EJ05DRAFT_505571 [Pseudovirgaria hyperparasitica]